MTETLKSLIRSRKVLLAALDLLMTLLAVSLAAPAAIVASINALGLALIAAIAYEDGKEKSADIYLLADELVVADDAGGADA